MSDKTEEKLRAKLEKFLAGRKKAKAKYLAIRQATREETNEKIASFVRKTIKAGEQNEAGMRDKLEELLRTEHEKLEQVKAKLLHK